jgi:class 3 adenylate cyclase
MFFADLVDSTALSTQVEPETYRLVVGRYREQVLRIVNRYEGHVGSTKGDGLLAVFGHPITHEDDVNRAVQAGLEITRDVSRLSDQSKRRFGFGVNVRVRVHWVWCIWTAPEATSPGRPPTWRPGSRAWRHRVQLLSRMRLSR